MWVWTGSFVHSGKRCACIAAPPLMIRQKNGRLLFNGMSSLLISSLLSVKEKCTGSLSLKTVARFKTLLNEDIIMVLFISFIQA